LPGQRVDVRRLRGLVPVAPDLIAEIIRDQQDDVLWGGDRR
jgi:hypothetical protein